MFRTKSRWLGLIAGLLLLASCNTPEDPSAYNQGPGYAQVSLNLEKPQQRRLLQAQMMGKISTLPPDTQSSMIVAVPVSEPYQPNYINLVNVVDADILDLTTGQVSLLLPLDIPVQLYEYTFSVPMASTDEVLAETPLVIAAANLGQITVKAGTSLISLVSNLTPVTPPKSISVVSAVNGLAVGKGAQFAAIANYADGSSQDMTAAATWSTSNTAFGTVTNDANTSKGLVTGVTYGSLDVSASLLGITGAKNITIGTASVAAVVTDFDLLLKEGSYALENRKDPTNPTQLLYYLTRSNWAPTYSEDFWVISEFDRTPTYVGNPQTRLKLFGKVWLPDVFLPAYGTIDHATNLINLVDPFGYVSLDVAFDISNVVEPVPVDGEGNKTINVAMGPGAKVYYLSHYIDNGAQGTFTIERRETNYQTGTTFATLAEFLAYGSTNSFNCTKTNATGGQTCMSFDYTTGAVSGTLTEYDFDSSHRVLATRTAGTWAITQVNGVDILETAVTSTTNYNQGGGGGSKDIWAVYQGQVYRGRHEAGVQYGTSVEYNAAASVDIENYMYFATAGEFDNPNYSGSYGGIGGSTGYYTPEALTLNGTTQWGGTSGYQTLGIANTWTIAVWFKTEYRESQSPLLSIYESGSNANRIDLYLSAGVVNYLTADIYDSLVPTKLVSVAETWGVDNGARHLAMLTWDGSVLSLSVDNAYPYSTMGSAVLADGVRTIDLGTDALGNLFLGQVMSVAMWDTVLSTSEQAQYYLNHDQFKQDWTINSGVYAASANLVHYWQFDRDKTNLGWDYGQLGGTSSTAIDLLSGKNGFTSSGLSPFLWVYQANYTKAALTSPVGGETLHDGYPFTVSWDPNVLTGMVDVYLLTDDPSSLDTTQTDLDARASGVIWQWVGADSSYTGSYSFDPYAIGSPSGNAYRILAVDNLGNWTLSPGNFSINQGTVMADFTDFTFTGTLNSASGVTLDRIGLVGANQIKIAVPKGASVTALVPSFTITGASVSVGGVAQTSGFDSQDFTNPVTYAVASADGTVKNYTVTVVAQIPIPDTGQTTCWDQAGTVITCPAAEGALAQDGSYNTVNQPSYTDNGDGTVTDNVTGLTWQQCAYGKTGATCTGTAVTNINWTAADAYCTANTAALPGTGWRMPTRIEISGLVNTEITSGTGAINATFFPATVASYFWTATVDGLATTQVWMMNFNEGNTVSNLMGNTGPMTRCVR